MQDNFLVLGMASFEKVKHMRPQKVTCCFIYVCIYIYIYICPAMVGFSEREIGMQQYLELVY